MIKFSALLANNNRSKAYLQNLIKNNFVPESAVVLISKKRRPEQTEEDLLFEEHTRQSSVRHSKDANMSFDEKENIINTLEKANLRYEILESVDINSKEVIDKVKNLKSKYILYSGPGGIILKEKILSLGKKFIHVHPGWLPEYKGSTTFYYSVLVDKTIACSVILMSKDIDSGPVLYRKKFKITEKNIDFDYVLDPLSRASTLLDFFNQWENKGIKRIKLKNEKSNIFYIIHPVLKHLAILKIKSKK